MNRKVNKSRFTAFSLALLLSLMIVSIINAQQSKIVESGVVAGVPYASSNFEHINLTNGNLSFTFPLASLPPGRGSATHGYSLRYNSKLWESVNSPVYDPSYTPNPTYQDFLTRTPDGGWDDYDGYELDIVDRNEGMDVPKGNLCQNVQAQRRPYRWKVQIKFPTGGKIEFRPTGYSDLPPGGSLDDGGYFNVHPDGSVSSWNSTSCTAYSSSPTYDWRTYYSSDGSGMKLKIQSQNGNGYLWELSMPDGSKIEQLSGKQRITDRNGNYVETATVTLPDSTQTAGWVDQMGRYIARKATTSNEVIYYQLGFNGELLTWKVKWKKVYVRKNYTASCTSCGAARGPAADDVAESDDNVVESIELPSQLGGLVYTFDYYAKDVDDSNQSSGWGEVKSVTIPSGAKNTYGYELVHYDSQEQYTQVLPGEIRQTTIQILPRAGKIKNKKLSYAEVYDGVTTNKEDVWGYSVSNASSSVTGPDGSVNYQYFYNILTDYAKGGQVYKEVRSNGTIIERLWKNNYPNGFSCGGCARLNPYVKTEFTTITDSNGSPSLTAIKDYNYDKNGNLTGSAEYDWIPATSASIQRDGNGIVTGFSGLTPARKTATVYNNATLDASNYSTSVNDTYGYWNSNAPSLRNAAISVEIQTGNGTPKSRSELFYDNASTTGNLTSTKVWDSYKNGTVQAYSNPLTSNNSISTNTTYNAYGNPLISTDANGVTTTLTYGAIGAYTDLYPTQTEVASNQSTLKRTSTAAYDFYTGLVTSTTDVDNNLTSATVYDALGRPTIAKAGVGTTIEFWTKTEYDDANQRVITRSDLFTKEDGKKIAVQHFDQLGRVRFSRTIENAATEDPEDEKDGIKVQTRYLTTSGYSYQLTSNPYRADYSSNATSEPSMGWTLSKSVSSGQYTEVETFSGAGLPTAFSGSNTNSTGKVRTEIDASRTLVTDQAGKQRISKTNAFGQLTDVWEIAPSDSTTGSSTVAVSFPNQALSAGYQTSYQYDLLNNLTNVTQGSQTRTFDYSSLSRLKSATNPESGQISYTYDNNGNLLTKKDARNVTTSYVYDKLNRVTEKTYSVTGSPTNYQASLPVTYTYDNVANAKGKLTKISSDISETKYTAFDVMGRVTASEQKTPFDTETVANATPRTMVYEYNLSGTLIKQNYPSGREVKTVLDNEGDLSMVQSKKNSNTGYWTYANSFTYTAAGAVSSMQLGNGKWESTVFNSRLQPTQIALGTVQNGTDKLKLEFSYNTMNGSTANTDNNGNVLSQKITVPTDVTGGVSHNGFTATQSYTYDALNRLKSAEETIPSQTGWKQTYKYDRYGNRTFDEANTTTLPKNCGSSPNYTVCASDNPSANVTNNKLAGFAFDNAGNTTTDANSKTFIYDSENKQTEVKNSLNQILGQYYYDGDGKRVKKYVPGTGETTIFVYDASGKLVAEYSTIVATQANAKVSYLTSDHLGSPRINTDADGKTISRHDYQPFGAEITVNRTYGSDNVRKKFTGYEKDEETELNFAEVRMYNSNVGRFTTADPYKIVAEVKAEKDEEKAKAMLDRYLSHPQQWNLYVYTLNNPLKYTDPSGEVIYLTGTARERADALQRLKNQLGEERFSWLSIGEICDTESGTVTRITLTGEGENGFKNASPNDGEKEYTNGMAELLRSDQIVEYKISKTYSEEDHLGKVRNWNLNTSRAGGYTRVNNGRIQIYVSTGPYYVNQAAKNPRNADLSSDGKPLKFTNEMKDAHEFGHALDFSRGVPSENHKSSVNFENIVRSRNPRNSQRRTKE